MLQDAVIACVNGQAVLKDEAHAIRHIILMHPFRMDKAAALAAYDKFRYLSSVFCHFIPSSFAKMSKFVKRFFATVAPAAPTVLLRSSAQ